MTLPRGVVLSMLLVALLIAVAVSQELLEPQPNAEKCAALVGPSSTDAEREAAFLSPLCADVRNAVR